jgi:ABC-type nickel/cobalt efflux system permease component RcnA
MHRHGSGPAHSHAVPDGPLGWKTLAGMGVAGGLVPSPSALIVLLGATALGRAWFGVVLVVCYGVGMAVTLTAMPDCCCFARRPSSTDAAGRWGAAATSLACFRSSPRRSS